MFKTRVTTNCLVISIIVYLSLIFQLEASVRVKGNKIFDADGSPYFIKGLVYQSRYKLLPDPTTAPSELCKYDSKLIDEIGANTLLLYNVNLEASHDECMNQLKKTGLQVMVGLHYPTNDTTIALYDTQSFATYKKALDVFAKFDNFMGAVVNGENLWEGKAIVRDLKKYAKDKLKKDKIFGVSLDKSKVDETVVNYLNCKTDSDNDQVDFIGIDDFNACDKVQLPAFFASSTFKNSPVPIFYTNLGCPDPINRQFSMFKQFSGTDLVDGLMGGFVYELKGSEDKFGLVEHKRQDLIVFPAKSNLILAFRSYKPKLSTNFDTYSPSPVQVNCPSEEKIQKPISTPDDSLCNCVSKLAPCKLQPSNESLNLTQKVQSMCQEDQCIQQLTYPTGTFSQCSWETKWQFGTSWSNYDHSDLSKPVEQSCSAPFQYNSTTSAGPLLFYQCDLKAKANFPPLIITPGESLTLNQLQVSAALPIHLTNGVYLSLISLVLINFW